MQRVGSFCSLWIQEWGKIQQGKKVNYPFNSQTTSQPVLHVMLHAHTQRHRHLRWLPAVRFNNYRISANTHFTCRKAQQWRSWPQEVSLPAVSLSLRMHTWSGVCTNWSPAALTLACTFLLSHYIEKSSTSVIKTLSRVYYSPPSHSLKCVIRWGWQGAEDVCTLSKGGPWLIAVYIFHPSVKNCNMSHVAQQMQDMGPQKKILVLCI